MRYVYLTVGWISFVLGMIGLALPIMPTTPFLVVTAYCFSKGSDRLHDWLLSRPYIGTGLKDWEDHGVIRPKAKIMAVGAIILSFSGSIAFAPLPAWGRVFMAATGVAVIAFILTRPSAPKPSGPNL